MIGTLQGPWLLYAAVLLLLVVIWRSPRPPVGELWPVGLVFACAAMARLVFGFWGPLHVNGQGPLWIRGAFDPGPLAGYGPGYYELFHWAAILGATADRAIFAANAVLSALSPALLYITGRLMGVARGGALAAAVVLAADPVSVRTAATEGYFSSLVVLVLAVQAALALGVRVQARGDRWARYLAFAAAGLLAGTVARIHPMSYLPLALCPLVVLGAAEIGDWRARLTLTAGAAAAIGVSVLLTSATTITTALRASPMTSQAFTAFAARDALMLLALTVIILLLQRWLRPPLLPLLGVCSLLLMLATQTAFQQSPLWQLCYQRIFFAGILLGAAPLIPPRLPGPGCVIAGAMAATFLFVQARPYLTAQTTEQLEYRFLQEALRGMPPRCALAGVSRVDQRLWEIPSYLIPESGGARTVGNAADLASAPSDCLLYVRSSLCSSAEARALCESVEREARLERVTSRVFPPTPSYTGHPYDRAEVEVVLFRVSGHGVGVPDGAAISPAVAQQLYDRLRSLSPSADCRVTRFDTRRFRIAIGLETVAGQEHTVELATTTQPASRTTGEWVIGASDEGKHACAGTLAAMERVLNDIGAP